MKKAILAAIFFTSVTAQAASYELITLRQNACHAQGSMAATIYSYKQRGYTRERMIALTEAKAYGETKESALDSIKDVYDSRYRTEQEASQLAWARCMDRHPLD